MAFTTKDFPGQTFDNIDQYREALARRELAEKSIAQVSERQLAASGAIQVTATVLPIPRDILEKRVSGLESEIKILRSHVRELLSMLAHQADGETNFEGVKIGVTLYGTTKGQTFTLEPLKSGYLCSDGRIYDSLSGAALGVSGNRRSGWVFWKEADGKTVGEITGRHEKKEEYVAM